MKPDFVLCAEDAPRGRPAPFLLFEAAKRMDVFPMYRIVKVDDTPAGIAAGRNAGCWTIGITRTGNCVGLSVEALSQLSAEEVAKRCDAAEVTLREAGADYVIESVAKLESVIDQIDNRVAAGERPAV